MIVAGELASRVSLLTAVLALGLAGACGLWRGPADAAGVLVGSTLTLLNFGGLHWAATRAPGRRLARSQAVWIGASGLRLGVVATVVGLVVAHDGIGLAGLLLSLILVPVAVVVAGLRAAGPA